MKRICLFAGYDNKNIIHDYVVYYLKELSTVADVYYMADNEISDDEKAKITPYVKEAYGFNHKKYDFGSWQELIKIIGWEKLSEYDELILANDSVFGPLYPIKELSVSEHSRRIEPAIHYINQYYKETIPLQDLAQQCCMSPNYFHKIFKQIFRITPFNYQMLLRMNSALQLLTDKEQTIKDIAFELGFTDNAHFCKTFKKFYGVTPGEYQRNKQIILL